MQTYAKLTVGGALQRLTRHPYISNATAEQLAEYASAQGYKPLLAEPCPAICEPTPEPVEALEQQPAPAWLPVYTETPEGIVQSWKQEGE